MSSHSDTVKYYVAKAKKSAAQAEAAKKEYEKKFGKPLRAGNTAAVKGFKELIADLRKSAKKQLKIAKHNIGEKVKDPISKQDGLAMEKAFNAIAQKSAYSSDYSSAVSGEPVAKRKTKKPEILDKGAASKKKPRPTRLKYSSDTAEGAEKQKKARELRGSSHQDTGESPHKKLDFKLKKKSTAGMKNTVSSDQGKPKPKPTKAKWKVEYGKIIDEAQEEQNLKKGGLVTKRGPMHRSSKRK